MTQHSISKPFQSRPEAEPPVRLQPPDFTFQISTGRLFDTSGKLVAAGLWAGQGEGKNNPAWQAVREKGPLPVGLYRIGALEADGGARGPDVMRLTQLSGVSFGRSGFMLHGASAQHRETSSSGCIIAPRATRDMVDTGCSPARLLAVTV